MVINYKELILLETVGAGQDEVEIVERESAPSVPAQ